MSSQIVRPRFHPFDERGAVRIYQRGLPHWRQAGATYFVTFRLADSIPADVRRQWDYEQATWLNARGIDPGANHADLQAAIAWLSQTDQSVFHKHFNRQVQACLDRGIGDCFLRVTHCIQTVREKLFEHEGVRHHLGDFVIMPNHVHLLTTPADGFELEDVLKQIKGASAFACNRKLGRSGAFWQQDSYDHIVRSSGQLVRYRQYISDNPETAGITVPADAIYRADWMDEWLRQ